MKAGIITTPDRDYIHGLTPSIISYVDELHIFNDAERRGIQFNWERCLDTVLKRADKNEPCLFMTDDVVTVPDWYERFNELREKLGNEPKLYTFMARQKHLLKYKEQGYFYGIQKRGFYDHAFVVIGMPNLVEDIREWFDRRGKDIIPEKRQKHYDVVIQDYFVDNNIPWVITIPTLFNHIGDKSALGHNIGGSICYIGEDESI